MNNIIKRVWNQNRMVNIEDLCGMAFQAESGGHTFEITGIDDTGSAVVLSGTVAAVFRRPDNADIALTGSASNGVVSVTLTDDCYAVAGRFGLTIFVTSNSQKVAVYACVGTVAQTNGGAVAGSTPQDVVDLINAINAAIQSIPADYSDLMAAIAPTYSDQSVYPAGAYRWYNGVLYKSKVAITSAESFTAAHWSKTDVCGSMTPKTYLLQNLFGERSSYYLKTDGTLYTAGYKRTFPASNGDTLFVSGRNWTAEFPLYILLLNGNVVGYASGLDGSTVYNNLEVNVTVDCDTIVVNGAGYSQISAYKKIFIPYTTKTEDNTHPFAFADLFDYEDTFVDDFYPRTHVSDSDHPWTMIYNADTLVEPSMAVGTGIRDQARATALYMVREFDTFPHVVAIGNSGILAAIVMYANDYSGNTMFTVDGGTGQVKYDGNTIGYVNKDSKYYILDIEQNKVRVYDDVGLYVDIPISYDTSKPMNAGLYFGTGSVARYGVSSWVELNKRDLIPMNIDKIVTYPSIGSHLSYGHQTTSGSASYTSVADNPYMSIVDPSGLSNNVAISCEIEKADDNGFRTEMTFRGQKSFGASIFGQDGILQRFRFCACYMMPSENLNGDYRTYIFQIHDGNFAVSGWVDAPPVHLYEMNEKLYAVLSYIDDGDIPASDNRHTTAEYYLCDFPRDTWIKVELEIRIAWKAGMCPRLRVVVDNIERLNVDLPVGYNIVSSGGYTYVKAGVYCPQWKTGTYQNMKRNVIVANMKYED